MIRLGLIMKKIEASWIGSRIGIHDRVEYLLFLS